MQASITLAEDIKQQNGMQLVNPFLHLTMKELGQSISFRTAILTSGLEFTNGLTLTLQIVKEDSGDVVYDVPEQNVPVSPTQSTDNFQITANVLDLTIEEAGVYIVKVTCNGEVVEQPFSISTEMER